MSPARFAKLVAQFDQAEADMRRAFNRYARIRAQVKRAEKTLDRAFVLRANGVGGQADVRELAGDDVPGVEFASGPDFDDVDRLDGVS